MQRRALTSLLASIMTATVIAGELSAQTITATIDARARGAPIQPLIYGMFVEHAGSLLEQGFRAELLDDRKFYYAIGEKPPARPGPFRSAARGWQRVGMPDAVRMDSTHHYASDHAPLVTLGGTEPAGITQNGIALKGGVGVTGRIVVAGDADARVAVSLVWGTGAAERQTIRLVPLSAKWTTQRLQFAARPTSTDSARLEIIGTGRGAFRIGAVSLMPADNVQGFRREVVSALASLHSGVYRFPGGNFVSGPYDWRGAIGDPDRRPPRWDPVWGAVQPNDFGLDEFMTLCGLLDVAPYVTVNAGFGDAFSAAQQVEYANGAPTTPMGRARAANGHPKPYAIKYWGIGNEMWGDWQYGYMALDQWIAKQGQFARAMRQADPTILLVAPGAMPDAMTGSGMAKKLTGQAVAEPMGKADWSAALLSRSIDDFEILSQHFYVYGPTHYDLVQGKQVPDDSSLSFLEWSRKPANMVRVEYEHFRTYQEKIPSMRRKPITVALDEWAYTGSPPGAFKPVPAYAWALNELFRHSDVFTMGGFTFAGSTLSASRTDAVLNPIGLMFKLYRDHFGTIPLGVSGTSPQPERTGRVGGEIPNVNAGSATYPLDVAAALSADGTMLTISVVNPSDRPQTLRLEPNGLTVTGAGTVWRMAPGSVTAANLVGREPQVRIDRVAVSAAEPLAIPAISVGVYAFPIRTPRTWTADNGNGTFTNPIFFDEFSDPDIIRVGDDFFLTGTTMHAMPGLPVLHSTDLLNWELESYALDRLDLGPAFRLEEGKEIYGRGIWAPSFRYHAGTFHIFSNVNGQTTQHFTATSPRGPWTRTPMKVSLHDLSVLFDDDGKVWVVWGYRDLHLAQLDATLTDTIAGTTRALFAKDALIGEGSHLYKIDGKYFITSAWYAGRMRMPSARADRIEGPWEINPSISADEAFGLRQGARLRNNGNSPEIVVNPGNPKATGGMAMHQGGIVQTPAGEWWGWSMFEGNSTGRLTALSPVTWKNGWPYFGLPGNLGRTPRTWVKPKTARPSALHTPYVRDDEFSRPALANVWQWNHAPDDTKWSLKERPGFLRLHSLPASDFWWARNSLTQRAIGPQSTPTTVLETAGMKPGDVAGLALLNRPFAWIGVRRGDDGFWLERFDQLTGDTARVRLSARRVSLRAECDFLVERCAFSYATDGAHFTSFGAPVATIFQLKTFQGVRYALFHYNARGTAGGYADFDAMRVLEPHPRGLARPIPVGRTITLHSAGRDTPFVLDEQTHFTVVDRTLGRVALRAGNRYVSVAPVTDSTSEVSLRAGPPSDGETFQWMETPYGDLILMSLRTHRYLRLESDGRVTGDGLGAGPDPADPVLLRWR